MYITVGNICSCLHELKILVQTLIGNYIYCLLATVRFMDEKNTIESLLDLNDDEIKQLYNSWDKGDCSLVGLTEIYLYQCIKKHKKENGAYYDTDYDNIHLRYGQH